MLGNKFRIRFRYQAKPFVVLMDGGRVGSTYFQQALNLHPEVCCLGEVLLHQEQNAEIHNQWIQKHLSPPLIGRYRAIGFKIKQSDILDPIWFSEFINKKKVQVILSRRRNQVKLVLSWINWERLYSATGQSHIYKEKERFLSSPIDIDDFEQRLKHVEQQKQNFDAYIKTLKTPIFELYYEDLFLDQALAFKSIFSFLGVPFVSVQGKTKKNTSDDLRKAIANFDELRSHYIGTAYEPMFDEVLFPSKPRA